MAMAREMRAANLLEVAVGAPMTVPAFIRCEGCR
jgi:hypothetical protein